MENKVRQDCSRRKASSQASRYRGELKSPARPLRALFQHLNQPEPSAYGRQRITEHAATSMRVIQLGLSAIGSLLAQSAVQVEEHTIPAESVESLGRLMAELGELAALCHELCTDAETATVGIAVQESRDD
jgi:hypothetical protein